ncbi:DUF2269 family protein [Legionella jordanis]|uniref:Integral membrane protein n=1 Tax=Legionella jordanis TaxID=456 RepID=A0A0W0V7E6_9GAMM|nr:DUF2269 domain-containing protein [Legionella jordanis]KTD16051.1 integral membrane protein [Legionella jordanis]RMX04716.1 DUF2269 domain-containing protein [Legionella jordanis]RMX18425.1 DUF2269 domain-containing protein [Legionella jordanis]VEH12490.1 integral membrane protein [Legionella jordanis]HAT8714000.1 DUF2269 family protein [Legionella jordanis]
MLYLWLKYIHILSSTILFGTGIGTACVMLYGHWTKDLAAMAIINRYVVLVDWLFTGTSGFIQAITGLTMVYIAKYPLTSLWIWGGITGYIITALCWFPVVYLQIRIRDITVKAWQNKEALPEIYYTYFKWWFALGWPAFISLLIVFYLMVMKPF